MLHSLLERRRNKKAVSISHPNAPAVNYVLKIILSGRLAQELLSLYLSLENGHSMALGDRARSAKLLPTAEAYQKEPLSGCQRHTKRHRFFSLS